jgi:hypothetical protein
MSGIKISDLPNSTLPYTGSEELLIVQSGSTKSGNLSSLVSFLSSRPVATSSVASAVSGMTEEQKQELLPNTVEVDYFVTTDQTGYTIPTGAFGQKSGVPYFGNNPIVPGAGQTRQFVKNINQSDWLTNSLGTFSIPSGLIGNSQKAMKVEFDLMIKYGTSPPPTYSNFE